MVSTLPLAAARERLRRKPGRPRKYPPAGGAQAHEASAPPGSTHGGLPTQGLMGSGEMPVPVNVPMPRLLDVAGAARYLALSPWTVRDLISNGTLPRVRVPLPNNGELRRVLVDREDLDRLVTRWKESAL